MIPTAREEEYIARIRVLETALRFYADAANYDVVTIHFPASYDEEGYNKQEEAGSYETLPVVDDGGVTARNALEG